MKPGIRTILSAGLAVSMAWSAGAVELIVPRAAAPPKIDGRLDDACWQAKPNVTEFRDVARNLRAPTQPWVAWVCSDGDALYIAAKCWDEEMDKVPGFERGHDARVWRDDCIEVFLMPGTPYYYHIAANLEDGRYDGRNDARIPYSDRKNTSAWDGLWYAAGQRAADHWTMEFAIPFASLELGAARISKPFRINLGREQRRLTEFSCWPASGFHEHEEFAELKGLKLDAQRYGLRLADVTITQEVPAANRFSAIVAEEPAPGQAVTLRLRARALPRGKPKKASTRFTSRAGAKVDLYYIVPLCTGQVDVVAECLDPAGRVRASLRKVFYPPPILDAGLDMPLYYQSDGAAHLAGRITVARDFLARSRPSLSLVALSGKNLRGFPVTLDGETGEINGTVPFTGLAPGRYTVEVSVSVEGVTEKPEVSRFPFRVIAGPLD